jgi:hypothetical protein
MLAHPSRDRARLLDEVSTHAVIVTYDEASLYGR